MKPIVFLHGWAQSSQIWFQQRETFADAQFLNLPGHGGAADAPSEKWVDVIAGQLPKSCVLVGWSLGGMLAIELLHRFPERIAGLALVAATPRFRKGEGWSCGCDDTLFSAFETAVNSDSSRQLNRFFAMMLHADGLSRSDYNRLAREGVDRAHPVTRGGLQAGLELLGSLDLRDSVERIGVPILVVHGQADAVVSVDAGRWLSESIAGAESRFLADTGHAPFLSRPEQFNRMLDQWRCSL